MNRQARATGEGNAATEVAENTMSGTVRVTGDASQSAGATPGMADWTPAHRLPHPAGIAVSASLAQYDTP